MVRLLASAAAVATLCVQVHAAQTVFGILLLPVEGCATPAEIFNDTLTIVNNPPSGGPDGASFLGQVDRELDIAARRTTFVSCTDEPYLHHEGAIVYDQSDCPLSNAKLVSLILIPCAALCYALVCVKACAKRTRALDRAFLGLSHLSIAYDVWFCYDILQKAHGSVQELVSVLVVCHLCAVFIINALFMYCWLSYVFRDGEGQFPMERGWLRLNLSLACLQPESALLLEPDFSSPSSKVLARLTSLRLLNDLPQLALQLSVWIAVGDEAPASGRPDVTFASILLCLFCIVVVLLRLGLQATARGAPPVKSDGAAPLRVKKALAAFVALLLYAALVGAVCAAHGQGNLGPGAPVGAPVQFEMRVGIDYAATCDPVLNGHGAEQRCADQMKAELVHVLQLGHCGDGVLIGSVRPE